MQLTSSLKHKSLQLTLRWVSVQQEVCKEAQSVAALSSKGIHILSLILIFLIALVLESKTAVVFSPVEVLKACSFPRQEASCYQLCQIRMEASKRPDGTVISVWSS